MSRSSRWCTRGSAVSCLVIGVAMQGVAPRAAAAEHGAPIKLPVRVETSACGATPLPDVVAVLRGELGSQLLERPTTDDAYRVAIDCSGDVVVISVGIPDRRGKSFDTNLAGKP